MENLTELSVLLIEDDPFACEEIRRYIDHLDDMRLVGITNDANKALEMVRYYTPDAIILGLELHHGVGNGITFLANLHELSLEKLPYILITTQNTSKITFEAARQLGADFIIAKYEKDYSAQKPIEILRLMKDVIQQHSSTSEFEISPADHDRKLAIRIQRELDRIGVNPKVVGYQYLTDAILIATKETVSNIPRLVANKHNKTTPSVERAMQNAINRAWSTTNPDELAKHYTAAINCERGVPTMTEFIYYYANKFRNEL